MSGAHWRLAIVAALALLALTAAPAGAQDFRPGATSLGDPLYPQIGNGGYDALHYAIDLRYDPGENRLEPGTRTTITAVATHPLSRFSLDFQRDLEVTSVLVDGQPARFRGKDAKPRFSSNPAVTQPAKLHVTPPAGIPKGAQFSVEIAYSGVPVQITDGDESIEGWVRACSSPGVCDGSFTVNEPIGAQSWFPSNDYATDKASFATRITAPDSHVALGAGELESKAANGDGTTTWSWLEDDPMAPYLATATVGRFDYAESAMTESTTGLELPIYDAIDSAAGADRKADVERALSRTPSMLNFLSKRFGPYPFDSIGVVADWVPAVGYALENQTKPHFSGDGDGPAVQDATLLHEIAHQWMGNSISARHWTDLWFNEGWATFAEVYWGSKVNDERQTPRQFFQAVIRSRAANFALAPATLDGDPANLFDGFAVYSRPGAMIEGYRQIVGNKRFFAFARGLGERHAYSTINRGQFIGEAKRASGLGKAGKRRLGRYFRQWLLREDKPALRPADFR